MSLSNVYLQRYEASLLSSDNAPIDIESHLIEQVRKVTVGLLIMM